MAKQTIAQLTQALADYQAASDQRIQQIHESVSAQIAAAKPKSSVAPWVSASIAFVGVLVSLGVAMENRQWLAESQTQQAAQWQKSQCLNIAQFASQMAAGKTGHVAKGVFAAIARQDPNCANIEELAIAFAADASSTKSGRLRSGTARGFVTATRLPQVKLSDRFYLGAAQMRGFDIRGVGPRVQRKSYGEGDLGGQAYYQGRDDLEIPNGAGAKELGLRPSVFLDAGTIFQVPPVAEQNVTANEIPPRLAMGFGTSWNSPFGPFRIDIAKAFLPVASDDTKTFRFNGGTQF